MEYIFNYKNALSKTTSLFHIRCNICVSNFSPSLGGGAVSHAFPIRLQDLDDLEEQFIVRERVSGTTLEWETTFDGVMEQHGLQRSNDISGQIALYMDLLHFS